jgi:hypothetical protein
MTIDFEISEASLRKEVARRVTHARAVKAPVCYIENGNLIVENQDLLPSNATPNRLVSA